MMIVSAQTVKTTIRDIREAIDKSKEVMDILKRLYV